MGAVYDWLSDIGDSFDEGANWIANTWERNVYNPYRNIMFGENNDTDGFGTGLQNAWYTMTGETEKTSAYKALMEREDTAYQRAAKDMMNAGLSKFGGVGQASSTAPANSDPIAKAYEMQQLRGVSLANKQAQHDLDISKSLGIRSGDKNILAGFNAIWSLLFGHDGFFPGLDDKVIDWLGNLLGSAFGDHGTGTGYKSKPGGSLLVNNSGYVPFTVDQKPTGSELGAFSDQERAMTVSLDQLKSMDNEAWRKWVNDQFVDQLSQDKRSGVGKAGGYMTLPESLTSQTGHTYESDLSYWVNKIKAGPYYSDPATVERFAKFLSQKYNKRYTDVYKALSEGVGL